MERRTLVGGGLMAGLGALAAAGPSEAAREGGGADNDTLVAGAVGELRRTLQQHVDFQQAPWRIIARVRDQQRTYLRASQKYPDFIEVGLQIWESVYDWHVHTGQPVTVTRLADGRYSMVFTFTTLLLRPELDPNYVGFGFDGERPPQP